MGCTNMDPESQSTLFRSLKSRESPLDLRGIEHSRGAGLVQISGSKASSGKFTDRFAVEWLEETVGVTAYTNFWPVPNILEGESP